MQNGTETINDFLNGLQEGNKHLVDVAREMLKGDDGKEKENITFALQKRVLQPEPPTQPVRKESGARNHVFYSVTSLVDYLKENKTDHTVVLADVDACSIDVVLDETVKCGFEFLSFKPQVHPLFAPWKRIIGTTIGVKEFALFLLQNKRTVCNPEAKSLTLLFSQIRASQKITMHKGIGPKSMNGLVCEINIVGKEENQEVEIPDLIEINVPIFIDTLDRLIEIDVLVDAEDTEVYVMCSSSDLKVKTVTEFESMLRRVR